MTKDDDVIERVTRLTESLKTHVLHFALRSLYGREAPQDKFAADLRSLLSRLTQAEGEVEKANSALKGIADDYMTSENHHPGYVLIPTQKFEQLVALASTSEPLTVPEGNSSRDLAQSARGAHAMGEARHADETDWPLPAGVPTYEDALKLVLHFRKPSVSFIQRKLQIGYNKACDYIEIMEAKGIVSRSNSAGVRTMLAPAIRREDESHG